VLVATTEPEKQTESLRRYLTFARFAYVRH
jgi:hypothetical protein